MRRGFNVMCPRCMQKDGMTIRIDDTSAPDFFYCRKCDEEWSFDKMQHLISEWSSVLVWINTMPQKDSK